jgi:hypothetical protein
LLAPTKTSRISKRLKYIPYHNREIIIQNDHPPTQPTILKRSANFFVLSRDTELQISRFKYYERERNVKLILQIPGVQEQYYKYERNASDPFQGLDSVLILLSTGLSPEHHVFARWGSICPAIKAIFHDDFISIDVCE